MGVASVLEAGAAGVMSGWNAAEHRVVTRVDGFQCTKDAYATTIRTLSLVASSTGISSQGVDNQFLLLQILQN